jgi:hypothetical protein
MTKKQERKTFARGRYGLRYPIHAKVREHPNELVVNKEHSMNEQIPSIGRLVHYRLSADDATQINRRRTDGRAIRERLEQVVMTSTPPARYAWPEGAQAHIGNTASEGDTFPMLITRVCGDTPSSAVNGQAFLDGNDVLWVTSACVGEGPRTFSWPVRS